MIRYGVLLFALLLAGCTSSNKEQAGNSESKTAITFLKRASGAFISDEVRSSVASKRRSKLSQLQADGPAWFQFKINQPFEELKLSFVNQGYPVAFSWVFEENSTNTNGSFKLENVDNSAETISLDIVILNDQIEVYFNEGEEIFTFVNESETLDYKIEVYINGEKQDLPGVLLDINV